MSLGPVRHFSEDITHTPAIKDPEILQAFNSLMAASWSDLPNAVVYDAVNAVSKDTDDKDGQEVLKNVFRAAEASEEFGGILKSLKMELNDSTGMTGEDTKPLSEELASALDAVLARYMTYLALFKPEETYLKKKVESELGAMMIYLKMRCGGLDSHWGEISVLGTSGLSGSYVEKRA
jgi:polyribonucleotide nucleotidyltransferase